MNDPRPTTPIIHLGVNVDHVATVRQARRSYEPDPVIAAALAEQGGADAITFHLREDRRHIQDRDVEMLMRTVTVKTNFELACSDEIIAMACRFGPDCGLLVPESREEVTTEGGLDVVGDKGRVADSIKKLKDAGILVSLFIDPDVAQVEAAAKLGAQAVELHTGPYALAGRETFPGEFSRLASAGEAAIAAGLHLHAGHGLNYQNVKMIATLRGVSELNIGHSIISRAVMVGMKEAVSEMRRAIGL